MSYNNRSLFSDYYLEELAGEDSHWRALKNKSNEYRQRIGDILRKAIPGINGDTPEAEVERRLIRPILDTLEHVYFVQPAVPSSDGVRRPDYAFFPSQEARQEAEYHKGELEFFKTALAVGDAKAWERSLDKRVKGPSDPFTNHNPSYQIDFYLRATERKWGLLTNGRHWRLYHRDLSYRLDVYYEVDVPQAVTLDEDAFLHFLAFFHREAFQPDGTGECFLDRAYRASTEYAARVSEELKDNVYEALRLLAEGFLSFPGNGLKAENLDLVRENAFIVIYRLLFILYAEAREFLPVTNSTYLGTYSLRALTHEIETKEPLETNLHPTATGYWSRLQELFRLINNGDDFLRIPPYNGRLFDDQKEHQSLATWKLGDRYLAAAIDRLARARAAGRTGRGFVSYRDLSIRELGSVYEGLLEHRPRYTTQDVAVVKDEKREKFVPLAELAGRRALKTYRAGSVYLETDKGERKATGSYYTPDYIVKYIVSNTLGPLLEEAKKSDGNLIDTILSLKVLDPAMGSGHFLVEATDYLARALVEALGGDPPEMEEDEIRWARREVVERCIYGVDLNPLAVDLAKLSLWLSTVSLDKPLNFLNHHLRCGNSLIGGPLNDLGVLPEPGKKAKPVTAGTTLAGHKFSSAVAAAVSSFYEIMEAPSATIEDIHRKESAYETARYALCRVKDIADIWTSVHFGNQFGDRDGYESLLLLAESGLGEWPVLGRIPWVDSARRAAEVRRFFHWELEFPEAFFDRKGQRLPNPGFHAVVGNPPYVSFGLRGAAKLAEDEHLFYLTTLSNSAEYKISSYALFMEVVVRLTQASGRQGYVVPDSFLLGKYFSKIRAYLLRTCAVDNIVMFQEDFWQSGTVGRPVVYVVAVYLEADGGRGRATNAILASSLAQFVEGRFLADQIPREFFDIAPLKRIRLIFGRSTREIVRKLEADTLQLKEVVKFYSGLIGRSGQESICVFGRPSDFSAQRYGRLITSGRNLDRFCMADEDAYCVKEKRLYKSGFSPAIYEKPKLFLNQTGDQLKCCYDAEGYYCLNNMHVGYLVDRRYDLLFVNSLLCSSLVQFYYRTVSLEEGRANAQTDIDVIDTIPIRRINFTTAKTDRERLAAEVKGLYAEYLTSKNWDKVQSFVGKCLPLGSEGSPDTEREQSDVVHDLLAFLAEEMTRLHKEKQAEIKGFLHWLEGYLGVPVEELKNKTKVKEYWKAEAGWEGFFGAVEQNRRAVQSAKGIDVTRRGPQEAMRAEFEASMGKLRVLLERIEPTDKLIDQIVYKLYGLTEEEISIVEGRASSAERISPE